MSSGVRKYIFALMAGTNPTKAIAADEAALIGANCREHHYVITAWTDRAGKLLGVECEATVDAGAYSAFPTASSLEAAQIANLLPGPYDFPAYRCRAHARIRRAPSVRAGPCRRVRFPCKSR